MGRDALTPRVVFNLFTQPFAWFAVRHDGVSWVIVACVANGVPAARSCLFRADEGPWVAPLS